MLKGTTTTKVRNLQARAMKQRSKRMDHRNDRRSKDAKRSWKREEW
jgi:hypothetical protein